MASIDSELRAFRDCVGEFASGVTVVTSEWQGQPAGMTLNSFASVSLHPLLILISLAHGARTLKAISKSGSFAVSVLHRNQQEIAAAFAERGAPFPAHLVVRDRQGFLSIPKAAATLWCNMNQVLTAGDHDLIIGSVIDFQHGGGEVLVFHRGRLGGLKTDTVMAIDHPIGLEEGVGW